MDRSVCESIRWTSGWSWCSRSRKAILSRVARDGIFYSNRTDNSAKSFVGIGLRPDAIGDLLTKRSNERRERWLTCMIWHRGPRSSHRGCKSSLNDVGRRLQMTPAKSTTIERSSRAGNAFIRQIVVTVFITFTKPLSVSALRVILSSRLKSSSLAVSFTIKCIASVSQWSGELMSRLCESEGKC